MSDEITLTTCEYTDADGTGTCSQCGGQCMDPDQDGDVGITRDGAPICSGCAEGYESG